MTSHNMTCEEFDAALPDYLEGTLTTHVVLRLNGIWVSACVAPVS